MTSAVTKRKRVAKRAKNLKRVEMKRVKTSISTSVVTKTKVAKKRRKEEEKVEEKYEFKPPDFDEKAFLEKDIVATKTLFVSSLVAVVLGIIAHSWHRS